MWFCCLQFLQWQLIHKFWNCVYFYHKHMCVRPLLSVLLLTSLKIVECCRCLVARTYMCISEKIQVNCSCILCAIRRDYQQVAEIFWVLFQCCIDSCTSFVITYCFFCFFFFSSSWSWCENESHTSWSRFLDCTYLAKFSWMNVTVGWRYKITKMPVFFSTFVPVPVPEMMADCTVYYIKCWFRCAGRRKGMTPVNR